MYIYIQTHIYIYTNAHIRTNTPTYTYTYNHTHECLRNKAKMRDLSIYLSIYLSQSFPIFHCFWLNLHTVSILCTERMFLFEVMYGNSSENVVYWFVFTSPTCLAGLTWMVCETGGNLPYSFCFMGCCFPDVFKTTCSIFSSSHLTFSSCDLLTSAHLYQPAKVWMNSRFILSRSDIHMINKPVNSRSRFPDMYIEIFFSEWNIAAQLFVVIY